MHLENNILIIVMSLLISCSAKQSVEQEKQGEDSSTESLKQESFITFNDIDLYQKKLIGKIETSEMDWFIVSGTSCTGCDENVSIYLYPISENKQKISELDRYSYPGKVYYYEDNSLVFESRAFWGNCSDSGNQVIYWLQKELADDNTWKESAYLVEISKRGKQGLELENTKDLLSKILLQVEQGECFEIPGTEQTSEP